jgi:pyruvate-ferredoxin/flavodoxin oxidoreductase
LFRFDPARRDAGAVPLQLDCKAPSLPLAQFTNNESRYRMLVHADPDAAKALAAEAQHDVDARWARYAEMATAAPQEGQQP